MRKKEKEVALQFSARSESNSIGPGHSDNQDSYVVDAEQLVVAVCDGVGGYAGGKIASELAIRTLESSAEKIVDEKSFKALVLEIDQVVREKAHTLGYRDMGTTFAAAKIVPPSRPSTVGRILTANVGDSPILLFRDLDSSAKYEKAYVDDSHREEDPSSIFGLTQYLGVEEIAIKVHTQTHEYKTGDVLLLCSDGITDNLLYDSPRKNTLSDLVFRAKSADSLVQEAMKAEIKPDDLTAILVIL